MAFGSRVQVYHAWQNVDAELRRIKQAHERNRAQGKIATDCLGHSFSQIGELRLSCRHGTKKTRCTDVGGMTGAGREARI